MDVDLFSSVYTLSLVSAALCDVKVSSLFVDLLYRYSVYDSYIIREYLSTDLLIIPSISAVPVIEMTLFTS